MSDELVSKVRNTTPTEYLIAEVLVARWRCGEHVWTFPADGAITAALRRAEGRGHVGWKSGVVERTVLAWLTEAGRAEYASNNYVPPILRAS